MAFWAILRPLSAIFYTHIHTQRDKNCFNVFAGVRPFHRYVTWLLSYNSCVYYRLEAQKWHFKPFSGHFQPFFHTHIHTQRDKNCFNVFAGVRPFHRYITWLFLYDPCVINKFKAQKWHFQPLFGHFQPFFTLMYTLSGWKTVSMCSPEWDLFVDM